MNPGEKGFSLRILLLISTKKLADQAEKLFDQAKAPLLYRLHGAGTASSEMLDILGLGSIDKNLLVGVMPKQAAHRLLHRLHNKLGLGMPGSGVAVTLPLSGGSAAIFKMLQPIAGEESAPGGKEETSMTNCTHMLIAAVVNQGYSEQVMDAARAAGAGGGSVLHSRHVIDSSSKEAVRLWGFQVQEEKEIILIISSAEKKLAIMKAISEECGMRSKAQGLVMSLPIDSALGLGEMMEDDEAE